MAVFEDGRPKYGKYKKGGIDVYRRYLRGQLRNNGQNVEDLYRTKAYDTLGAQQRAGIAEGDRELGRSFGSNRSGLSGAIRTQASLDTPYGEADMAARDAGRRSMLQTGSALEASKQRQANWWATFMAPYLQEGALGAQNAFNLASIGGGGEAGGFGSGFSMPGMGGGGGGGMGGGMPGMV